MCKPERWRYQGICKETYTSQFFRPLNVTYTVPIITPLDEAAREKAEIKECSLSLTPIRNSEGRIQA